MRPTTLTLLLAIGIAVPLSGCGELGSSSEKSKKSSADEDDDDGDEKKKKKKKKKGNDEEDEPTAKPTATAAATATATATSAPTATAAATETPDAPPTASGNAPPGPNGRSAVPTTDEWTKAGEVTVLGSGKLDCETKMVREWVRVSCRGESKERGKPSGVSITKGGGKGDTFTFASGGVASLIYPFFEGQDLEASFRWDKTRRGFKAQWARGAPKPTAYGIFEGGDAHLVPKK